MREHVLHHQPSFPVAAPSTLDEQPRPAPAEDGFYVASFGPAYAQVGVRHDGRGAGSLTLQRADDGTWLVGQHAVCAPLAGYAGP